VKKNKALFYAGMAAIFVLAVVAFVFLFDIGKVRTKAQMVFNIKPTPTAQVQDPRAELEKQKALLDSREKELSAREKSLEQRESLLIKEKEEAEKARKEAEDLQNQYLSKIKSLDEIVSTFEKMKPENAAAILAVMEKDKALAILSRMKTDAASKTLEFLPPKKAAEYTALIMS